MAVLVLQPTGQGNYTGWTLGAGGSKTVAVDPGDPVSHDDGTTFIFLPLAGSGGRDSQYVETIPATYGNPTLVSIKSRVFHDEASSVGFQAVRLGATLGTEYNHGNGGGAAWTNTTDDVTAARPGGGAWQQSDFSANNVEIVVKATLTADFNVRATSMWIEATAELQPGGFISLIASLGPLAVVLLREMPALAAAIYRRTRGRVLIQPREYLSAWRELREARYPHRVFLRA